jgi:hypothetical protein
MKESHRLSGAGNSPPDSQWTRLWSPWVVCGREVFVMHPKRSWNSGGEQKVLCPFHKRNRVSGWPWWLTPVILATQEEKQEDNGLRSARQAQDPVWKQTKAKRTGGMAQVVQCLPSKFKALSSAPSTAKEKKPSLWSMTCRCNQSSDLDLDSLTPAHEQRRLTGGNPSLWGTLVERARSFLSKG